MARPKVNDADFIAVLVYTAARAGAVAKLRVRSLANDGTQWSLRFDEKGGKSREIPVRHDLQGFILEYMAVAGPTHADRDAPLFQSAGGRAGRPNGRPLSNVDVCRLVKRRLADAGLPGRFSPHSFRVTTVTDLLSQGVPLEDVQHLAGHADPPTTRLYDRCGRRVTCSPWPASRRPAISNCRTAVGAKRVGRAICIIAGNRRRDVLKRSRIAWSGFKILGLGITRRGNNGAVVGDQRGAGGRQVALHDPPLEPRQDPVLVPHAVGQEQLQRPHGRPRKHHMRSRNGWRRPSEGINPRPASGRIMHS
jgi:hypothetical protein